MKTGLCAGGTALARRQGVKSHLPAPIPPVHVAVLPLESAETATLVTVPDAGVCLDAVERALILFALERTGGNRTRAARLLGLTRSALLYRIHKHRLVAVASSRHDALESL